MKNPENEYAPGIEDEEFDESQELSRLLDNTHTVFCEDPTVLAVLRKYESRSQRGMKDYGRSMRDNDMGLVDWMRNLQEELMDASLYLEELMERTNDVLSDGVPCRVADRDFSIQQEEQ